MALDITLLIGTVPRLTLQGPHINNLIPHFPGFLCPPVGFSEENAAVSSISFTFYLLFAPHIRSPTCST